MILALETCTAAGSVAVLRFAGEANEQIIALNEWRRDRSHAEVVTPAIEDAVRLAGGWQKIRALAVGVGPGSFTGIRVGLNAARTIGWNLKLPVIPIRTTDAMITAARASGLKAKDASVAAVLNAQMGLQFAAWEIDETNVTDPAAFEIPILAEKLKTSAAKAITLIGESADSVASDLQGLGLAVRRPSSANLDFPNATTVARLASEKIRAVRADLGDSSLVETFEWRKAQPLYIRGSGAEEKMG